MDWFKLFFVVLALLLVVGLIQSLIGARRFLRRFGDSSPEAAGRFQEYLKYEALSRQTAPKAAESNPDMAGLERELLRALCARETSNGERQAVLQCLRKHSFADATYREVFQALRDTGEWDVNLVREQLPERLTRRGFPDIDFDSLLAPREPSAPAVRALIQRLEETSRAGQG